MTIPALQIVLLLVAGLVPRPAVEPARDDAPAPDAGSAAVTAAEPGPVRGAEPATAQEPEAILRATSRAYEAMDAVRADFQQLLRNPLLGRTTTSEGTLYQKEPDKFLMDFSDPEGDVIVSDGRYFWMYFPSVDEKQVLRTPRRDQALDLQAQFVGDPVQRFAYTYHGTETVRGREAHVMTLEPRRPAGYEEMKVWIDVRDHLVRRFELTEENGNVRHLELMDVRVNPTLPDSLFEFTPPADAIIVDRG